MSTRWYGAGMEVGNWHAALLRLEFRCWVGLGLVSTPGGGQSGQSGQEKQVFNSYPVATQETLETMSATVHMSAEGCWPEVAS